MKTVADRHRHVAYNVLFNGINIDDLE